MKYDEMRDVTNMVRLMSRWRDPEMMNQARETGNSLKVQFVHAVAGSAIYRGNSGSISKKGRFWTLFEKTRKMAETAKMRRKQPKRANMRNMTKRGIFEGTFKLGYLSDW